jgi:hypothetical protein
MGFALSRSFNGKPKAPAWTASNNDDVLGMLAANAMLFGTGAFGLPLNEEPSCCFNPTFRLMASSAEAAKPPGQARWRNNSRNMVMH